MNLLRMLVSYGESGKPGEKERPHLDKMIIRERYSSQSVAAPGLSHGFFRIERVIPQEAVRLFGNAALSRAHNRFSVHAEPGGPALFSALLSDPSLSSLVMNPNTGNGGGEATLERVDGNLIKEDIPPDPDPEEVIRRYADEIREDEVRKAETLLDKMISLKTAPGKSAVNEIIMAASGGFIFREQSFYLKQYQEAALRRGVTLRGEASNLIRNAHLLGEPDAPHNDEAVPVSSVLAAGHLIEDTAIERVILARAHAHEMMLIAERLGVEGYDPRKDKTGAVLKAALGYVRDNSDVDSISYHARSLASLIEGDERPERDPRHLLAQLSHINGDSGIHSDYGTDAERYVRVSFSPARQEWDYGQRRVSEALHMPFVSITAGNSDFLSALRGDSAGAIWSRCTINILYGKRVPRLAYVHPLDAKHGDPEREVRMGRIREVTDQERAGSDLVKHVRDTGLRTAADRKEAVRIARVLAEGAGAANDALFRVSGETIRGIKESVEEDVREKFSVMMRGRDARALLSGGHDVFGLIAGSPEEGDGPQN